MRIHHSGIIFISLLAFGLRAFSASFDDDVAFLKQHTDIVVLSDQAKQSRVVVSPVWQGWVLTSTAAGYFNEWMDGFEYEVAGHMIWEGMLLEGLAVTRAVHDRYHASRRNPWNEIECGDHYARSMASYGVYLEACGFEYRGPKQHIGFAPKLSPENFKSAFTSAEGWGTFSQRIESGKLIAKSPCAGENWI